MGYLLCADPHKILVAAGFEDQVSVPAPLKKTGSTGISARTVGPVRFVHMCLSIFVNVPCRKVGHVK